MSGKFKIVFLGPTFVGKTSLIQRIVGQNLPAEQTPTLQACGTFCFNQEFNEEVYNLALWDTAGQEQYRSITSNYYRNCQVAIFVYSIVSKDSFTDMMWFIDDMRDKIKKLPPVIIVGNKADLDEWRDVQNTELSDFCQENGFSYIETSAVQGLGISELKEMILIECEKSQLLDDHEEIVDITKESKGCSC